MRSGHRVVLTLILWGSVAPVSLHAAQTAHSDLESGFTQTVRPFVTEYCAGCHSGSAAPANLDLKSYATLADVVKDLARWNVVSGRLTAGQMPPKTMKQPPDELRQQVVTWIRSVRQAEAMKSAGDPGVLVGGDGDSHGAPPYPARSWSRTFGRARPHAGVCDIQFCSARRSAV